MSSRLTSLYSRLGRIEKLFLLLLILYIGWTITSPRAGVVVLLGFLLYLFAVLETVRLIRWWISKAIWRLRNRLIVAYAFIAIVPIALIAALAGLSIFVLTGGVATYLVNSELNRRSQALANQATFLARRPVNERGEMMQRMQPLWRDRYGDLQVLVEGPQEFRYPATSSLSSPPAGWGDAHGVLRKDDRMFLWAHARQEGSRVTILAPVDHDYLSGLIPGLGEAVFLETANVPSESGAGSETIQLDLGSDKGRIRTPPPYNRMDIQISGAAPLRVADWDRPGETRDLLLVVRTRTSALMRVVYGQTSAYLGEGVLAALVMIAVIFLVVEIVSLIIGVSLTRTITGAVHELYEGTQRIRAGDFSHRIAVAGNDQLCELGISFNRMTEDLERLFAVEKEKERLQSELEIAREVQAQLFPKALPEMRTLQLAGVCHPARMVSGDYYDFLSLDHSLAVAIGDVAGKGISAALLMAAIQSTMRTQLTGGAAFAAAAGGGGAWAQPHFSTAHVVSQLNKQLYANTSPEKYATFCFALYDEISGTLRYTNAGHLPPILLRDGQPELLEVTGTVVGAFPFSRYEERTITMNPGDLLTAYTDGVVEPENEYGEQFGEERLNDLLVKHAKADSSELIARVMERVRDWTGTSELQDDMTMVVIRRL